MRIIKEHMFFCRGYNQALFFLALVLYVWLSPPDIFEGTWVDVAMDAIGIAGVASGELLHPERFRTRREFSTQGTRHNLGNRCGRFVF